MTYLEAIDGIFNEIKLPDGDNPIGHIFIPTSNTAPEAYRNKKGWITGLDPFGNFKLGQEITGALISDGEISGRRGYAPLRLQDFFNATLNGTKAFVGEEDISFQEMLNLYSIHNRELLLGHGYIMHNPVVKSEGGKIVLNKKESTVIKAKIYPENIVKTLSEAGLLMLNSRDLKGYCGGAIFDGRGFSSVRSSCNREFGGLHVVADELSRTNSYYVAAFVKRKYPSKIRVRNVDPI